MRIVALVAVERARGDASWRCAWQDGIADQPHAGCSGNALDALLKRCGSAVARNQRDEARDLDPRRRPAALGRGALPRPDFRQRREAIATGAARWECHASDLDRTRRFARPVRRFVDLQYRLNRRDPHWVPPLRGDAMGLIRPRSNPWFDHGDAVFFLATRDGRDVGRIGAQIDHLWAHMPVAQGGGAATGSWGMFEAADAAVAAVLIARAEDWLGGAGVTRSVGPISLSMWDEAGLLVHGHDHAPTMLMGHHDARYQAMIESAGYRGIKDLLTFRLDITAGLPPLATRLVATGQRNPRIRIRMADKRHFAAEARLILSILNDGFSGNWGFVPFTEAEIAFAGKKLKPVVFNELVRIAELDGEPVAFMMALPDLNRMLTDLDGRLFPFGFAKLLWRMNGGFSGRPKVDMVRVPLMGVKKRLHRSRLAAQLAFMMIDHIRRDAVATFGARQAEIGWILADNQGMVSIAKLGRGELNKVYRIYEKRLDRAGRPSLSIVDDRVAASKVGAPRRC